MKSKNTYNRIGLVSLVFCMLSAGIANASSVGGQNWADSLAAWSGNIQNYNGTATGADALAYVLSSPDSDVDGNGYAWDAGDNDYVAGWKGTGDASFTLHFETALLNIDGDDLAVKVHGGPNCRADVYGSVDGSGFELIGSIAGAKGHIPGKPGFFHDPGATGLDRYVTLDFGILDNLHYVRFDRVVSGQGSGMFFDAVGSVPEPAIVDPTGAAYIKGQNWADRVVSYTPRIQRFGKPGCTGGVFMDPNTTWWVLGPNDCDQNGDMDAWSTDEYGQETIDYDYVAGWKGGGPLNKDQEIIVWFDIGLQDYEDADDLVIRLYCGYKARASVWVSADGNDFTKIGEIAGRDGGVPGTPGIIYDAYFDFDGLFDEEVHYIKVHRETAAPDTGLFFDSFASAVVVEPNTCEDVTYYGWNLRSDLHWDCRIDFLDYARFTSDFTKCNDPNNPNCDFSAFIDLGYRPLSCHGMWQSGFGIESDLNRDCYVDLLDLAVLADEWLKCNDPQDGHCQRNW